MVFVDRVKKKKKRAKKKNGHLTRKQNSFYSMNLQIRLSAIWLGNDRGLGQLVLGCLGTHVVMGGMSSNTWRDWGKGVFLFSGVPSRYPSPLLLCPVFSYFFLLPSPYHSPLFSTIIFLILFINLTSILGTSHNLSMRIERFPDVSRLYSTSFLFLFFGSMHCVHLFSRR